MAAITLRMRREFAKAARKGVREALKGGKQITDIAVLKSGHNAFLRELPELMKSGSAFGEHRHTVGGMFAVAVAGHAYDSELQQMLKKGAKDRKLMEGLGIKSDTELAKETAESRKRLALAAGMERLNAKAAELFPRAMKGDDKARKELAETESRIKKAAQRHQLMMEEFFVRSLMRQHGY